MEKEKEKKKLSIKEIGPQKLIILLMIGVLLVLSFPDILSLNKTSKDKKKSDVPKVENNSAVTKDTRDLDAYAKSLEERLTKILTKVEGIGSVEVMITVKGSKEQIILKDEPYTQESMNETDGEGGSRVSSSIDKQESTVIVDDDDGKSVPYVIKELEPEVEGIVVIAEGGDNVEVMTEIMDAVQVLFNVPAHKVKVMKMIK